MKSNLYTLVFMSLLGLVSFEGRLRAQAETPEASEHLKAEPSAVFTRHHFTVNRQNGKILFDGEVVPSHFREKKSKEVRLIEIFDHLSFPKDGDFVDWARKLRGPRTYTYDEVTQVDREGVTTTKPLVFFEKELRAKLDIEWNEWLNERQAELDESNRIRAKQESEAKAYQQQAHLQQLQTQALQAQAALAKQSADSLSVIGGETSLWEIELVPAGQFGGCIGCSSFAYLSGYQTSGVSLTTFGDGGLAASFGNNNLYGNGASSIYVKSHGRTSQDAGYNATQNNPGYRVGTVRKLAGY